MQSKVTVPAAGMSSADWDGVDPDIRERSYWTAREGCYARVQGFRDRSQGIVDGNLSEADALREVRAMLRATGYRPEPGTEGTIQDLNSDARQRLILDTNVAMVQGKAYRDSMMGSIAYPAQRLVRERYSRQPRDWARPLEGGGRRRQLRGRGHRRLPHCTTDLAHLAQAQPV